MSDQVASAAGYVEAAVSLARQYENVTFESVHAPILPWLPAAPGRALDIGAGTGRDAAALAARGHAVTAVEPTREFREIGRSLHGTAIEWLDDSLPELGAIQGRFDLILLSAVWMHLADFERLAAMGRLATLLAPGGRVILTLRHGPVPPGRRMFDVSVAETIALAEPLGLRAIHHSETADIQGRRDVWWTSLVLLGK
ncbi:class I SAM-dependent methyltransferase [Actinokineospora enzanensis]|uniref:class I SAM-dependent methyltransferase n=1 Tax=Actinokineospora enzanensis TaxID=155975 RepID=UPI00037F39C6|nr:class I SAM-dependent methyltransferase [Actinokineospora enzanensis]